MRDFDIEQLYTEQLSAYNRADRRVVTEQQTPPPQQTTAVSAQQDQQAPSSQITLEQARQFVAQSLTQFTKTLVDKQIGDQNWANEIFQELGKIMSNKLQDKFAKTDSKQPPQQPQPTTPTNPQPQATAPNNR